MRFKDEVMLKRMDGRARGGGGGCRDEALGGEEEG